MKKGSLSDWSAARQLLEREERWSIVVHEKPDGDALGSGSALFQWGQRLGKTVTWGGADPFPGTYAFLPGAAAYRVFRSARELFELGGLIICLDTSNQARSLPEMGERPQTVQLLVIDHHRDNEIYGDVNIVAREASATAEILWDLAVTAGWPLGRDEALALYTGLVTDSGRFSFKATTAKTHLMAAHLLEAGLNPQEATRLIYHNRTAGSVRLWGRAFCRVRPLAGGKAILSWLERLDFSETGAGREETEGLVNELMMVRGVSFAALLTEEEDQVRISLRSNGPLAAGDLARRWDGGGHRQAAGCRMKRPLEEAIDIVSREIEVLHE